MAGSFAVDEMQLSLDSYLAYYNEKRPHQGLGMNGRTPLATFIEGIQNTDEKDRDNASKDPTSVTAA
jgi:transposase InsO family protein